MGTRVSSLPSASTLTGAERLLVSQPSDEVTVTATDISVDGSDSSFNSTTTDFVALGFTVGAGIGAGGFSNVDNNMQMPSGVIVSVAAHKMVVDVPAIYPLVTEAAGESVTLTQWVSREIDLTTFLQGIGLGWYVGDFNVGSPATSQGKILASDGTRWTESDHYPGALYYGLNYGDYGQPADEVWVRLPNEKTVLGVGVSAPPKFRIDATTAAAFELGRYTVLENRNAADATIVSSTATIHGNVTVPAGSSVLLAKNADGSFLVVGNGGGLSTASVTTTVNNAVAAATVRQSFVIACTGETEAVSAGTSKVTFRMPYGFTLTAVRASLVTAQTSGSILTVDVNKNGTSFLSTKLTIDNTEMTSTTAATAAVMSSTALADDDEITIDVAQIGDGTAKGLKVALIGAPNGATESLVIPVTDEVTAITAGNGKVTFRMPYAFTLTGIRASLSTAQTSGSIFTVDVNEGGASLLSTKLTIDNTEKTSTTAATAPVLSDTALADDAEITVDVDQIGDGTAKGLKVTLIGYRV